MGDLLGSPAALTGSVGFQPPWLCKQSKDVTACFEGKNNQLTVPHTFHFDYSSDYVLKFECSIPFPDIFGTKWYSLS